MSIQHLLGSNVRRIRISKGWSQDKLAEESGLHRTYISGIERGVRNPTLSIISQVAIALDVPTTALLNKEITQ